MDCVRAVEKPTLPAKKIMLDLTKNWKRVIDSLYKGFMVIDTGGAIRRVNPTLERLTGYRADELMGNTCTMLASSDCEPWYGQEGFWCVLFGSGQAMKPMACRINGKSGYPMNVIKQASILRDAKGGMVGVVETIWGMADLKQNVSGNCCSGNIRSFFP